jgi:hypothetical protein
MCFVRMVYVRLVVQTSGRPSVWPPARSGVRGSPPARRQPPVGRPRSGSDPSPCRIGVEFRLWWTYARRRAAPRGEHRDKAARSPEGPSRTALEVPYIYRSPRVLRSKLPLATGFLGSPGLNYMDVVQKEALTRHGPHAIADRGHVVGAPPAEAQGPRRDHDTPEPDRSGAPDRQLPQ